MTINELAPEATLPIGRGDAIVCIPLYGAHALFAGCLRSVLAHTPDHVPILVADDAGPDPASRELVQGLSDSGVLKHQVWWLRQPQNLGFVGNVNAAFAASSPGDVVLLNSDCEVAEGWFEGLHDAAHADSLIATSTALTNHGTILSVPHRNVPVPDVPQGMTFADAAARVRLSSPRLRPRIPTAIGHCVYVRRSAIELVGGLDMAFAPAYGEEVDFSQRCLLRGLQHVVADEVLVRHHGGGSLNVDGRPHPVQLAHEDLVRSRYPYYAGLVKRAEFDEVGPLTRSLGLARQALLGLTVTIDGSCLHQFITGTQIHTLELIHALWRTRRARVRVIVPSDLGDYARETFAEMPGLETIHADVVSEGTHRDEIVHRPYQVSSAEDLRRLRNAGMRVVLTHQDLIAYRNPGYFSSFDDHMRFQRLTRRAMSLADMVLFFSRHAAEDALADDLIEPSRVRVIHIGIDHRLAQLQPEPVPPAAARDLDGTPYLLCLGTDFQHKNRPFALKLLASLRERHGWDGRLVLAGPRVAHGSSAGEEAEWLTRNPDHAEAVVELAAVDESEKTWLLERATAVVYPTTYEGFGLVPFEAADAGVPCLWAPQASLPEVLPPDAALIVPWSPDETADRVIDVLRDAAERSAQVERVGAAGRGLTWDKTAEELLVAYDQALSAPTPRTSHVVRDAIELEAERGRWEGLYWHLLDQTGAAGAALVGDDALLPVDAQRALAGLARRRLTRAPLLLLLRFVHLVSGGRRRALQEQADEAVEIAHEALGDGKDLADAESTTEDDALQDPNELARERALSALEPGPVGEADSAEAARTA